MCMDLVSMGEETVWSEGISSHQLIQSGTCLKDDWLYLDLLLDGKHEISCLEVE